ncbi:MAG: SLBB domain-containing protein, partial [bacterium]|nr:SLBB domain-containing protein [bacterium]
MPSPIPTFPRRLWRLSLWMFIPLLLFTTGCSGLSSLGLGGGNSKMLKSTETISGSVGFAPPLNRELNKTVLAEYIVEPSDVLYIEPANFDSPVRLPGDQPVQPDGMIELGQYGRLFVVGKSIAQIQQEAQRIIERKEAEAGPIVVRLIAWDSKEFYVLGDVSSPGAYHFDGNETVLDAIVAAGGLSSSASKKRIVLTRPSHPDNCRI